MVVTSEHAVSTSGAGDVLDLDRPLRQWLRSLGDVDGQATVFVPGSTAAVTTIELEEGCVRDLGEALERIAPSGPAYHHDRRWGDGNGFSHLRAALLGPSVTVPVTGGEPQLGTWQQVVLVECDNRPRSRVVVLSFVGGER